MCGRYYINDETAKEIEKLIRQINDSLLLACKERDVYPSGKAPVNYRTERPDAGGRIYMGLSRLR